jgi:hypothetical protein
MSYPQLSESVSHPLLEGIVSYLPLADASTKLITT